MEARELDIFLPSDSDVPTKCFPIAPGERNEANELWCRRSTCSVRFGKKLAAELDGDIFIVPKEQKILYHFARVVAWNYSAALVGVVEDIAARIRGQPASRHFGRLTETSVRNALESTPARALTGRIARGSGAIAQRRLKRLRRERDIKAAYRDLGMHAIKNCSPRKDAEWGPRENVEEDSCGR